MSKEDEQDQSSKESSGHKSFSDCETNSLKWSPRLGTNEHRNKFVYNSWYWRGDKRISREECIVVCFKLSWNAPNLVQAIVVPTRLWVLRLLWRNLIRALSRRHDRRDRSILVKEGQSYWVAYGFPGKFYCPSKRQKDLEVESWIGYASSSSWILASLQRQF